MQLVSNDAIYSDGDRYIPATAVVNNLKAFLPAVNNVLVLGSGLCSMVQVMHGKGYYPHFTVVEKDKVVLRWAMEFFEPERLSKIDPVCIDAQVFMERNTARYDLVFVDVFNGRAVPGFVFSTSFLRQCRASLSDEGHLAFNYIIDDKEEWNTVKNNFSGVFPNYHILELGVNRILISS